MNSEFRLVFPEAITIDSMKGFLAHLESMGLLYHLDDNPFDVYTHGVRTFSPSESWALIGFFSAAEFVLGWDTIWNDCFPDTSGELPL